MVAHVLGIGFAALAVSTIISLTALSSHLTLAMLSSITCTASIKLMTSSSLETSSFLIAAGSFFWAVSLSLLHFNMLMAVWISILDGLHGVSDVSFILVDSMDLVSCMGLGRVGVLGSSLPSFSSFSLIVGLTIVFLGAVGIGT